MITARLVHALLLMLQPFFALLDVQLLRGGVAGVSLGSAQEGGSTRACSSRSRSSTA